MKKPLLYTVAIILALVLVIVIRGAYRLYKLRYQPDTHDLEDKLAEQCNRYIGKKQSPGLAIAVVQGDKTYIACFGNLDYTGGKPVDTATVFEIGSITKVFTTELAQILADKGALNWNETIYDMLPDASKPSINDSTTLLSLATHTSGFPNTPQPLRESLKNDCDPYAQMSAAIYTACIKDLSGKNKPDPEHYVYSNMGMSVLANCLEARTGGGYDSLLSREILIPLSMNHTSFADPDSPHFAVGHDKKGKPTCHWHLPAFYYGCGGLRSTIGDMLIFLQANLTDNPLLKSFAETQRRVAGGSISGGGAKGWGIDKIIGKLYGLDENIVWKNGGTGGFKSYIGMIPRKNTGVVILSNQYNISLDALGALLVCTAAKVSLK